MAPAELAMVSPLTNRKESTVAYPVAATPIVGVPEASSPTLGVTLSFRLIPNCSLPVVEVQPAAQAVMVLPPEVRVAPETVTAIPDAALVATLRVCDPLVTAVEDKVPKARVVAPKLKVKVCAATVVKVLQVDESVKVPFPSGSLADAFHQYCVLAESADWVR